MGKQFVVPAAIAATALLYGIRQRKQRSRGVQPIILTNKDGVEVHILPVGAVIQRLIIPVNGRKIDVVLGFNKAATYLLHNSPYFGAIVGRCANRIARGKFELKGMKYSLATNNGPNTLHGGPNGFHRKIWDTKQEETEAGTAAVLTYMSPDGDEGYPGNLQVTVRYELAANAPELRVSITATTDKATPVNIAQHSYFNLAGHGGGTVLGHQVKLAADHYTPVDETQIPTGEILPVVGTPYDFYTAPKTLGAQIDEVPGGFDHNYVLFGMGAQAKFITCNQAAASTPRLAATVTWPPTGLTLDVLTTAPGVQFYTGGFLGDKLPDTKDGAHYPRFGGLCLETQNFPDAINQPNFPSVVLQPGDTYKHQILYKFSGNS
eukprot:GHRR01002919.1.p1 GENE.GHRR01002919.1~~GHRR01002919.1.p1  ORF type:complete len:377 (+),score=99.27 GHRR01002919.1:235-1365(+)